MPEQTVAPPTDARNSFLDRLTSLWRPPRHDLHPGTADARLVAPLVASAVLAVTLYTWPSWSLLHPVLFVVSCAVVWLLGVLILMRLAATPDELEEVPPVVAFLQEAGRRTGLVRLEVIGGILSVVLALLAFSAPFVIPLCVATALGFLRILFGKRTLRELRRLRRPPVKPPPPEEGAQGFVSRRFRWSLRAGALVGDHTISVDVHEPTYTLMRRDNPRCRWEGDEPRFDQWIVDGKTEEVDRTAYALFEIGSDCSYSTYAEISNALAFVQAIPYSKDMETTGYQEYWRYPIETLYDQTGDCEDTSILAAAVLRQLGHRVGTVDLPGHVALAVEAPPGTPGDFIVTNGRPMYYCETTAEGWEVGEIPERHRGENIRIYLID